MPKNLALIRRVEDVMLRKITNKIFSSKVFYMLFSLLAAVALWMYVELTENVEDNYTIENVPVIFKNENILHDKGFLISSYAPEAVSLTFYCTKSVASSLTQQPPTVEVNLASITATGFTTLEYEIIYPANINNDSIGNDDPRNISRISLNVDRLSRKSVPVTVDFDGGTASDDLVADAAIPDPQSIVISGPDEIISKIDHAFTPISQVNLSKTYTDDLEFVLFDENGEELDESILTKITTSTATILVTVPIRQIKQVQLEAALVHGAGSTDINTKVICEPQYITVKGDPDALKDFDSITLTTIDTTRLNKLTATDSWQIIIPNYLENVSGVTTASVSIELLGLEIGYYSTSNLQVTNTPPDLSAVILNQTMLIGVRGKREDLGLISDTMSIRVVVDLSDREPGSHQVPAKVFIDGIDADIGAVGNYTATVMLVRDTV
jgi:YbbR domain-containing protein